MDLHAQIMNLPVKPGLATANATDNQMVFYKLGHRDARHAAAELASAQSGRIARLEEALRNILAATDGECEHFTSGIGTCFKEGRIPTAHFGADRCCPSCIAAAALETK